MDQEPRPLLSDEERKRHNAPLEGEPCALGDSGLLSGSVTLGEENLIAMLRTHVDDCGNLVAAGYDFAPNGLQLVRVLSNGDLDWERPFPYYEEAGVDGGPSVDAVASDQEGSLFVVTQHVLFGFTATGERHPVTPPLNSSGWTFLERIEDVGGDSAPSSGTFVAGPDGYAELALPTGYVSSRGSGASLLGNGHVESAPLATNNNRYFPEAEMVVADAVSVPRGGLVVPSARLVVEHLQVSFERFQPSASTVVFEQDLQYWPDSFSLASRGGEYVLAVTPGSEEADGGECRSVMHWISRDVSFELGDCPVVVESLFSQDGTYWSLWADRDPARPLRLFRWESGASGPREVALELTTISAVERTRFVASLAKTPRGTVVVTSMPSTSELRFVEVDGAE